MKGFYPRALAGAVLAVVSATATAEFLVLDTEQKAASAVSAGIFTANQVEGLHAAFSGVALDFADLALRVVRAATTPEALLAAPAGVTINCSISGSVKARLTSTSPRALKLQWNDCVLTQYGRVRTFDGPMTLGLPTDNFRPQRLTSIRLGDDTDWFVERRRSEMPDQIDSSQTKYCLSLRGDIPTYDAYPSGIAAVITAAYTVDGYSDYQRVIEFPDGRPATVVTYKPVANNVRVRETRSQIESGMRDDWEIQFLGGTMAGEQSETGFGQWTQAFAFDRYRTRMIIDYAAWTMERSVNGNLKVDWAPVWGSGGCMSGWYSFRTRTPLIRNADLSVYDAGELVVNDSVTARFHSAGTVPADLPAPVNGMLLNLRVKNVGTFNYDVATPSEALVPVGKCVL
ncbi:hypothetical protein HNQ60_002756 [Povalibacter uvarum]|uniref:Uncharacterized protein n=1 Tax=Povalibacter uvarum TaxID=732238 RepID=A0A841HPM8_9GAMM|nr:hypothetical protein [Povalibacter uvarum]MBB6093875.1 hypothetical protein [Povalibacter uvarum]